MAIRIQRAFRNYMRYKNECARRIQRAFRSKRDQIAYVRLRDYGHQVLGGRKERRRFSLISMRRFFGDYLGVGNHDENGRALRELYGISGKYACVMRDYYRNLEMHLASETVAFSARVQMLTARALRSSKPSPRILVLVSYKYYMMSFCLT
jgi:myosin-1